MASRCSRQSWWATASPGDGPGGVWASGETSSTARSEPRVRSSIMSAIERSSSRGVTARISAPGGRTRRGMLSAARQA